MTLILSFMARKGGAGKTTYSEMLAAALARSGLFVVYIEADGQSNASTHMGVQPHDGFCELILGGREWKNVLMPVPQTFTGKKSDLLMVSASDQTHAVEKDNSTPQRMVASLKALRGWADVVIIDTSPGANNIHVGCYYASDYVLLPTLCTMDSVNSIGQTLSYLQTAEFAGQGELHAAKVLGILPNQYHTGERVSQSKLGLIHERYGHDFHIFPQINYQQAWELAHDEERGFTSVYALKAKDYRERESKKRALKDFQPVVDYVMALLQKAG